MQDPWDIETGSGIRLAIARLTVYTDSAKFDESIYVLDPPDEHKTGLSIRIILPLLRQLLVTDRYSFHQKIRQLLLPSNIPRYLIDNISKYYKKSSNDSPGSYERPPDFMNALRILMNALRILMNALRILMKTLRVTIYCLD